MAWLTISVTSETLLPLAWASSAIRSAANSAYRSALATSPKVKKVPTPSKNLLIYSQICPPKPEPQARARQKRRQIRYGGPNRTRTRHLRSASAALYQMSYRPNYKFYYSERYRIRTCHLFDVTEAL